MQHYAGEVATTPPGFSTRIEMRCTRTFSRRSPNRPSPRCPRSPPPCPSLATGTSPESEDCARAPRRVASPSARGFLVSWRRWWRNWTSVRRILCDASSPTARWRPPRLSRATSCANFDAAASSRWFASADSVPVEIRHARVRRAVRISPPADGGQIVRRRPRAFLPRHPQTIPRGGGGVPIRRLRVSPRGPNGQMEDNRTRKAPAVDSRWTRVYRAPVARAAYRRERAHHPVPGVGARGARATNTSRRTGATARASRSS